MTQIPHDLMTAILDNTASDLPRLIVADWLEEHGESERSEFIRVQIELAKYDKNITMCKTPEDCYYANKCGGNCGVDERDMICCPLRERNEELSKHCIDWFSLPKSNDATSVSWSRGFPSSVRCTIADFMPGECEKCNGKGVLAGYPNALSFSSCGPCHGTGKSPFLAAVIGGWPVARIEFSNKEPMEFRTGYGHWRWLHTYYVYEVIPQGLPSKLYKLLKPHGRDWGHDNNEAFYPTRELAISALSDAAVRYARGEWERHAQPSRAAAGKGDPEAGEHGDGKMKTPRVANGNATRG